MVPVQSNDAAAIIPCTRALGLIPHHLAAPALFREGKASREIGRAPVISSQMVSGGTAGVAVPANSITQTFSVS